MFTRISLFILTNLAVLAVAALVLNLLGIDRMVLNAAGEYTLNYTGLVHLLRDFRVRRSAGFAVHVEVDGQAGNPHRDHRRSLQPD